MTRSELIKDLKEKIETVFTDLSESDYELIAEYVEEDRRRICAPLLNMEWHNNICMSDGDAVDEAIRKTIELAGLDKE